MFSSLGREANILTDQIHTQQQPILFQYLWYGGVTVLYCRARLVEGRAGMSLQRSLWASIVTQIRRAENEKDRNFDMGNNKLSNS